MKSDLLAKQLWALNGPVLDSKKKTVKPTAPLKDYASGIVAMVKAALTAHLPGLVSGTASPGGPLQQGAAKGGKFVAVVPAVMTAIAAKSNPIVAPAVTLEATVIAAYILEAAKIVFDAGAITGTSTETPTPTPGPLVAGGGKQGKITKLVGKALAKKAKSVLGATGPTQVLHYTTICDFIMTNAVVTYAKGTVIGTMNGGKLKVGAAAGGKVT